MRLRTLSYAAATAVAAALTPAAPVAAQAAATINVSPTTLPPGDALSAAGTTDCASVAYTLTLTYTAPNGSAATATATGTTDAAGEFTQGMTIPDDAVAGAAANLQASVECSGGPQETSEVPLTIEAHEGTLAVDPGEGPFGTEVTISGTNCWGGEVVVAFGDGEDFPFEVTDVTLAPDRTFTATFVIPDEAGPGDYAFAAECPGTDFPLAPFRVTGDPEDPDEPVDNGGGGDGNGGGGTDGDGATGEYPQNGPVLPSEGDVPAMPVAGSPNFTG